jgi:hypothetical protein
VTTTWELTSGEIVDLAPVHLETIPAPPPSRPARSHLLATALDAVDRMSAEDLAELFGALAERLVAR